MRALIVTLALNLAACGASEQAQETPPAESAAPASTATASVPDALASMPGWDNAREAGVDFRAVGQEPGWMLDIYRADRIVLLWDYGEHRFEFPRVDPTDPQEFAQRYETNAGGHTLVVTTRRAPCEDAMSGAPYPATVEVVIDGRTLNGCGKSV